mmetsp:Transcript_48988/g.91802  ORF Transcript_48988/g.91802 Transcript_48988/m.91802 type:complete len:223 (+) Transcript_48988:297-965(+)
MTHLLHKVGGMPLITMERPRQISHSHVGLCSQRLANVLHVPQVTLLHVLICLTQDLFHLIISSSPRTTTRSSRCLGKLIPEGKEMPSWSCPLAQSLLLVVFLLNRLEVPMRKDSDEHDSNHNSHHQHPSQSEERRADGCKLAHCLVWEASHERLEERDERVAPVVELDHSEAKDPMPCKSEATDEEKEHAKEGEHVHHGELQCAPQHLHRLKNLQELKNLDI